MNDFGIKSILDSLKERKKSLGDIEAKKKKKKKNIYIYIYIYIRLLWSRH